jgi:hypothetical protein
VLQVDTNVSEDLAASTLRQVVSYGNTAQHHNPENFGLNLHFCENLKSQSGGNKGLL